MTAVLSALLSHWTAVVTALQQDPKKRILAFSTVAVENVYGHARWQ